MRRALLLLISVAVALAACTGVFFDKGNAFPCDFSKGPGARDAVCVKGDVCGTDNLCHPFIYEGPRFEGQATIPTFEPEEFVKIHPLTLDQGVTALVRKAEKDGAFVQYADGGWFEVNGLMRVTKSPTWTVLDDSFAATLGVGPSASDAVIGLDTASQIIVQKRVGQTLVLNDLPTGITARRIRGANDGPPRLPVPEPVVLRIDLAGGLHEVVIRVDAGMPTPVDLPLGTGFTGAPLDVAILSTGSIAFTPVVTTSTGLWLGDNDGGFDLVFARAGTVGAANFRLNDANTMLVEQVGDQDIATWFVDLDPTKTNHFLTQAWPQCQPCRETETIELATPVPPRLGFAVEVLCRSMNGGRTLRRVEGAVGATGRQACISTELDFPLDPDQLAEVTGPRGPHLVGANVQEGVAVGGINGELWRGDTLSTVLPVALERVPTHVFEIPLISQLPPVLSVLTDRYPAGSVDSFKAGQPLGIRRIDLSGAFGGAVDVDILAPIRAAPGWVLLGNGVLARVSMDDAQDQPVVEFGPHLTNAAGDDIRSSIGGEAFSLDGGLRALFVTADDGLYFVSNPNDLTDSPSGTIDLTPELIPEPSVPIRSLALERTPLGTDGTTRARGYLVTSRNVYEWRFGGTPPRWTSKPLNIAGGEPIEVWFDREKSALGRVGFSDGRIFTLPGGYQLAEAIPGDDTETVALIDYENFGGWPVALATTGLYVARWDTDANGKLQNHFPDGGLNRPMEWHEITLPDGSRPWMKGDQTEGKLFVQEAPLDGGLHEFKLYVFTPNLVMQVGAYTR